MATTTEFLTTATMQTGKPNEFAAKLREALDASR